MAFRVPVPMMDEKWIRDLWGEQSEEKQKFILEDAEKHGYSDFKTYAKALESKEAEWKENQPLYRAEREKVIAEISAEYGLTHEQRNSLRGVADSISGGLYSDEFASVGGAISIDDFASQLRTGVENAPASSQLDSPSFVLPKILEEAGVTLEDLKADYGLISPELGQMSLLESFKSGVEIKDFESSMNNAIASEVKYHEDVGDIKEWGESMGASVDSWKTALTEETTRLSDVMQAESERLMTEYEPELRRLLKARGLEETGSYTEGMEEKLADIAGRREEMVGQKEMGDVRYLEGLRAEVDKALSSMTMGAGQERATRRAGELRTPDKYGQLGQERGLQTAMNIAGTGMQQGWQEYLNSLTYNQNVALTNLNSQLQQQQKPSSASGWGNILSPLLNMGVGAMTGGVLSGVTAGQGAMIGGGMPGLVPYFG